MIIHLSLLLTVIISVEFFFYFNLSKILKKVFKLFPRMYNLLILKKNSDYWKEKLIIKYSLSLLKHSLLFLLSFIFIIFLFFVINYFFNFYKYLFSLYGFIELTLLFFIYIYIRNIYAKL